MHDTVTNARTARGSVFAFGRFIIYSEPAPAQITAMQRRAVTASMLMISVMLI
jgi:hypothetical protein